MRISDGLSSLPHSSPLVTGPLLTAPFVVSSPLLPARGCARAPPGECDAERMAGGVPLPPTSLDSGRVAECAAADGCSGVCNRCGGSGLRINDGLSSLPHFSPPVAGPLLTSHRVAVLPLLSACRWRRASLCCERCGMERDVRCVAMGRRRRGASATWPMDWPSWRGCASGSIVVQCVCV